MRIPLDDLVVLGSLLHDIGKPVQRSGSRVDHSRAGADFLKKIADESGKIEFKLFALFSEYHHYGKMNEPEIKKTLDEINLENFGLTPEEVLYALWLVYEADNISSMERKELESEFRRATPLYSVFNDSLGYPVRELEIENPLRLPFPFKEVVVTSEDYQLLVNMLSKDLAKSPLQVDRLLPVLEKYLTFVSSYTKEKNTISLYDHSRMTAAIALAMLRSKATLSKIKSGDCRREKVFLLIEGDFSGIQEFIYQVSGKGTLKYLRARSAYLDLISWDVVLKILKDLNLTRANVIFNAGGHFLILGYNSEEAIKKLEAIRKDVVKWLWEAFGSSLYLGLDWIPVNGEELGKQFFKIRAELKEKLTFRKLQRFSEIIDELESFKKDVHRLAECPVCGLELYESGLVYSTKLEEKLCKNCKALVNLGEILPKAIGFSRVVKREPTERVSGSLIEGPFSLFIGLRSREEISEHDTMQVLLKNTLSPSDIPLNVEFIPYFVADYYKEIDGRVATFQELANSSVGAKWLGIIKGDVDKLGMFFGTLKSISEVATASRFMDYFFKAYLNAIIEGRFGEEVGQIPSLSKWNKNPNIVVVYAGGDDFFIVGAWSEVFDLAFRVREAFKTFTGESLSVSMGFATFDPKLPIYRMAQEVSERLETAKSEGRNRVFIVDRSHPDATYPVTYEWDFYKTLWQKYASIMYAGDGKLTKNFEKRKSFLWRLLELRELYVRNPSDVKWAYLSAYYIGRHFTKEENKLLKPFAEFVGIDTWAVEQGKPQPIYWIDGILKPILLAIRR